jgi:hypothetical protein
MAITRNALTSSQATQFAEKPAWDGHNVTFAFANDVWRQPSFTRQSCNFRKLRSTRALIRFNVELILATDRRH